MQLTIKHPFLCLPVVSHPKDTRVLKLFDGEKLLLCVYFPFGEAAADNGTYSYEYLSPLPVSEWMGRTLTLSAEFPAGFEDAVQTCSTGHGFLLPCFRMKREPSSPAAV